MALDPLSALLDTSTYGYRFKSGNTINHLLYMDEVKLYAMLCSDIGMIFGQKPHCQQRHGDEHQWNQLTRESDR